jgi:hypothetical protein
MAQARMARRDRLRRRLFRDACPYRLASRSAALASLDSGNPFIFMAIKPLQKLLKGQARVQNLGNKARANGVVTPLERARICAAQNIQSARIFLKRHN